ncbi:flagellin [Methylorubrum rhodesianum]|uniref:flagellin N-terminal helical domain-containing protein n=1 Tax=Methylorubrum rhodesianum TaxID=29427 RepID=UPI003D2C170B
MSSGISLTSSTRSSLLSLQSAASAQGTISERLSTGKKVNSAIDNAVSFFTASSLSGRATTLSDLLDNMSNGVQTIQAASKGLDGMKKLVEQMQATVKQARQDTTYDSTDATTIAATKKVRDNLKTQFLDLAKQMDNLSKDSGYNGVNLLNADELQITFNERTGTAKNDMKVALYAADGTTKEAVNATKLGIVASATGGTYTAVTGSGDDFTDNAGLDKLSDLLTTALTSIQTKASSLGSNLTVVQTRQDFTKQLINVLKTGSDNLVNADMNEEAANFTALQTRQSIAQQTLSLANQQQQGILQLLR